jgi:hypothetical protein
MSGGGELSGLLGSLTGGRRHRKKRGGDDGIKTQNAGKRSRRGYKKSKRGGKSRRGSRSPRSRRQHHH